MERILIVDDEAFIRENLQRILTDDGYQTVALANGTEAIEHVSGQEVDLVLLDLNLGPESGLDILRSIKEIEPDQLVIVITGYGTVESAVEALKLGAYDYLKKPFKADSIRLIVKLALETNSLRRKVRQLRRDPQGGMETIELVGESQQLREVYQQICDVAEHNNATVLITGDSGTGKELVARGIHSNSLRRDKPFIEINCGSLPFSLLESELFGHERGAFTDAKSRKIGLFEEANGGTLFLDEVGEMDMSLQVKLLRVLEDRRLRRLGGTRNIEIDVRIVAATNRNLHDAIEKKEFREDLYYRLNVFPIHVAPLRERRDDIEPLFNHFLQKFSSGRSPRDVSVEALGLLHRYDWPGNVRELRNVVERICIMYNGDVIEREQLPHEILGSRSQPEGEITTAIPPDGLDLEKVVDSYERAFIEKAIEITGGNVAQTARLLNVPRGTLRYKLEKYHLG